MNMDEYSYGYLGMLQGCFSLPSCVSVWKERVLLERSKWQKHAMFVTAKHYKQTAVPKGQNGKTGQTQSLPS